MLILLPIDVGLMFIRVEAGNIDVAIVVSIRNSTLKPSIFVDTVRKSLKLGQRVATPMGAS